MREIELFYRKYNRDVFRYIYSLCKDTNLAEDIMQETFLRAISSINSFNNKSSVKTWLFSIARHSLYDYYSKNETELPLEDMLAVIGSKNRTDYSYGDLKDIIDAYLEDENQLKKDVFNLRIKGYSYDEISEKLGISSGSARVIFFRLKNKLKQELIEEGYYE